MSGICKSQCLLAYAKEFLEDVNYTNNDPHSGYLNSAVTNQTTPRGHFKKYYLGLNFQQYSVWIQSITVIQITP